MTKPFHLGEVVDYALMASRARMLDMETFADPQNTEPPATGHRAVSRKLRLFTIIIPFLFPSRLVSSGCGYLLSFRHPMPSCYVSLPRALFASI